MNQSDSCFAFEFQLQYKINAKARFISVFTSMIVFSTMSIRCDLKTVRTAQSSSCKIKRIPTTNYKFGISAKPRNKTILNSAQAGNNSISQDGDTSAAVPFSIIKNNPALAATTTLLSSIIDSYNNALAKHPVATKALTSLIGFAIGDRIAQSVTQNPFDIYRCLRLSLYGFLIDGPIGHYFYQFLDKNICSDDPKSTRAVVTKTAIDQLIWAPAMTVVFLAFLTTLEGGNPERILGVIKAKLVPIMLANFGVWPLVHLVNFRYVAPQQRILFNNVVAIAWTTYLSYVCGGGVTSGSGTPRDALAGGLPCAAQATAAAVMHTQHILRQTSAVESMLLGWGGDALPDGADVSTELLVNYVQLKAEAVRSVCAVK